MGFGGEQGWEANYRCCERRVAVSYKLWQVWKKRQTERQHRRSQIEKGKRPVKACIVLLTQGGKPLPASLWLAAHTQAYTHTESTVLSLRKPSAFLCTWLFWIWPLCRSMMKCTLGNNPSSLEQRITFFICIWCSDRMFTACKWLGQL